MRRLLTIATLSIMAAACGGGGGSSSGNSVQSSNKELTLTNLNFQAGDVITNTVAESNEFAALGSYLFKSFTNILLGANTAHAESGGSAYPLSSTAPSFPASRKLVNGELFRLDPVVVSFQRDENGEVVKDEDGNPVETLIECDLSNVEVSVEKAWRIDMENQELLVQLQYPTSVSSDCSVNYGTGAFVVTEGGDVFNVESTVDINEDIIIPANDPVFNQSSTPLLITNEVVRTIEIQSDNTLLIKDLTSPNARTAANQSPIYNSWSDYTPGFISYKSPFLLGTADPTQSEQTFYVYEKDSTAFRLFKPQGDTFSIYKTLLDHLGNYVIYTGDSYYTVDINELTLTPFAEGRVVNYRSSDGNVIRSYTPIPLGRYDTKIVGDSNFIVWDYETGDYWCILESNPYDNSCTDYPSIDYLRVMGKYVYIVYEQQDTFVRYDIETNTKSQVRLSDYGYIANDFQVFDEYAVAKVVNTADSDKIFVEINFDTQDVMYRGTISQGDRKADTFIAL